SSQSLRQSENVFPYPRQPFWLRPKQRMAWSGKRAQKWVLCESCSTGPPISISGAWYGRVPSVADQHLTRPPSRIAQFPVMSVAGSPSWIGPTSAGTSSSPIVSKLPYPKVPPPCPQQRTSPPSSSAHV